MSDLDVVLSALPRIYGACRARGARDAAGNSALSEHQVRILRQLDETDPTMVTELADFMGVTPSTMSINLKRLREAGVVRSERDPQDRRVMNVRLTEAGVRLQRSVGELDPERVAAVLATLRPEQRVVALRGLALLAEAVDRLTRVADSSTGPSA